MPWEVTGPLEERQRLVQAYLTGRYSVSQLAESYGVSRKTVHKFLQRYRQCGPAGLVDRSHAAHDHPNATPANVAAAVIRQKRAHPTWGPLKLEPGPKDGQAIRDAWPAPSTRGLILARAGLTKARRRRPRVPPSQPFGAIDQPNATWCADFKGWFRTTNGERCDPFTVSDAYSRMLLCCRIVARPDHTHVRATMERLFKQYGLPEAIRTDNGPPFASVAAGGLSRLAVWWVKLGIRPERIQPGHPEQNGRHERMHRTLMPLCHPAAATPAAQQRRFDAFLPAFNFLRPHQALGQKPPSAFYYPSPRRYPARLEDPVYEPGVIVRRVRTNGEVRWGGELIFLSEALSGEAVGISETTQGYTVSFGPIRLGILDTKKGRLIRPQPSGTSRDL